jgi:nucleotide-binding universal stress UspA family protein
MDPLNWQIRKAKAQTYLREVELSLQEVGLHTETHILEGLAAEQILGFAETYAPQLIILSSHGQSGLSDWGMSSIAQKVVLRAKTSVMIVHASHPMAPDMTGTHYRRILAPLDGTQRAEITLPAIAALARTHDVQIVLAHVVQKPALPRRTLPSREDVELADKLVTRNRAEVAQYLEQLQLQIDGKVKTRIVINEHPAATLHQLVEQEKIDLILLSAHGRSEQTRVPYGDVVSNMIAYGSRPLIIMQNSVLPTTSHPPNGKSGAT